ncbi:MAG: hypothetical protein JJE27_04230 [Thermoleophilia bacterium]|nr:hypothetical protein [Thermoleophilia bacterium]
MKTTIADSGAVTWLAKPPMTPEFFTTDRTPFELREAVTEHDHASLDRVRPLAPDVRALRQSAGGRRWAMHERDSGDLVYTAWTYSSEAIVSERPAIKLPLPAHTWQLEDSYVPRPKRGTQGMPAAVQSIGETYLEHHGHPLTLITKIDVDNIPALKAAEHANWKPFATVYGRRVIGRPTRWRIEMSREVLPQLRSLERNGRG